VVVEVLAWVYGSDWVLMKEVEREKDEVVYVDV